MHRASEVARLGQVPCGAEQHCHVPIVTASMHLALVLRTVIKRVHFLHIQSVHVGAQADGAPIVRFCALQCRDHTGTCQPPVHFVSKLSKLSGDKIGGAKLLERRLGMRVEIATPSRHLVVKIRDPIDDGHRWTPWKNWQLRLYLYTHPARRSTE